MHQVIISASISHFYAFISDSYNRTIGYWIQYSSSTYRYDSYAPGIDMNGYESIWIRYPIQYLIRYIHPTFIRWLFIKKRPYICMQGLIH